MTAFLTNAMKCAVILVCLNASALFWYAAYVIYTKQESQGTR